ncbi:hypothetical protein FBU31_001794 [Coemansia sp. 'formosensis']|nr:hypothetical protein FBU31_001794 [Coemansia sp. 'formosensis']
MFKTLAKQACEWKKKVKYPLSSMECEFNAGMFWEAAHKVDVKHGGGLCGLDGFQTICVPCHSSVYSRNYSAEVASLSFLRSPSEAPSHASTSLLQSADWASPALLSAQCRAPPGFVYSPTQSLCSAYSTTESQLAATPARTSLGRQHADTSPVSLSSASPSSLPSPTSNYVLCAPSHSRLPETPTKSPPTNMSSKLGGIRCQLAQHEANPSNQLPLVQLSATIDLTTSTREVASHACDRPELDSLADMLTTINISSSGEESSSEVEIVPVVTQRMPLSTRKIDANSHKQGDTQQQQRPVAKAKDASANEGRARPGLAQRPLSDNPSALRRPSLTRMSSRSESASQENSPAARGVAPLTSDSSTKESTVSTTRRGQLPDRHILLL